MVKQYYIYRNKSKDLNHPWGVWCEGKEIFLNHVIINTQSKAVRIDVPGIPNYVISVLGYMKIEHKGDIIFGIIDGGVEIGFHSPDSTPTV